MTFQYLWLFYLWLCPILSFYTASFRQSSYFFSLTWAMVGHFLALLLLSVLRHCLQFGLESIWPGKSRHCTWTVEGHCPVCAGKTAYICTRMIDTSQTLPLDLIGRIDPRAVDSCRSSYGHWVDPQTVDLYTTDLYLILLSDHNDNISKYNKKIVTDHSSNSNSGLFSHPCSSTAEDRC